MSDLNNMMCPDVFLTQSGEHEQALLRNKVGAARAKGHPLHCWDVASAAIRKPGLMAKESTANGPQSTAGEAAPN